MIKFRENRNFCSCKPLTLPGWPLVLLAARPDIASSASSALVPLWLVIIADESSCNLKSAKKFGFSAKKFEFGLEFFPEMGPRARDINLRVAVPPSFSKKFSRPKLLSTQTYPIRFLDHPSPVTGGVALPFFGFEKFLSRAWEKFLAFIQLSGGWSRNF